MSHDWQYFTSEHKYEILLWMQQWASRHPDTGLLVLLTEQDKELIPHLQHGAKESGLQMVGAIFPELVVNDRFAKFGLLIHGLDPMPAYRLLGGLSSDSGYATAITSIQSLVSDTMENGTLMLIFDGMFGQVSTLLDELFFELDGRCRYAGVNAGSETFQPMPCLFDQDALIGDGVLALALVNNPGAVLEHGYIVPEDALPASAASGNRIIQIDWKPAFQKYAELTEKYYGIKVTRENFYSLGVHFPFALIRIDGQVLIRIPVAVDDSGALFCVGEIPDSSLLTVARAVVPEDFQTVDTLLNTYQLTDKQSTLFFYCAGRRMHLGDAAQHELARLSQRLAPHQLYGALSLGEIGESPAGGYPLFHNATLVGMTLEHKD